ncbi:MAG: hypothetical protein FWH22_08235 [Fibromonadales bacterium]|nr:hypothetical protein [Fibromonadales bacterium]
MKIPLPSIENNHKGYEELIALNKHLEAKLFDDIEINISYWFSANLCAFLGCILDKAARCNGVKVSVQNGKICNILQRNGFLAHFGYEKKTDYYNTTIPYLKLKPKEDRFFNEYVTKELLQKAEFPVVSDKLRRKITESICEIFINAQIHSETDYIYVCGQFFPEKKIINFTIVDRGLGFKKKINDRFSANLNGVQAIKWALENGHSTKQDAPGGIGLAILKEFIKLNRGKVQIISDNGFLQIDSQNETTHILNESFAGAAISMEFRTDDNNSYIISNEINCDEIF